MESMEEAKDLGSAAGWWQFVESREGGGIQSGLLFGGSLWC